MKSAIDIRGKRATSGVKAYSRAKRKWGSGRRQRAAGSLLAEKVPRGQGQGAARARRTPRARNRIPFAAAGSASNWGRAESAVSSEGRQANRKGSRPGFLLGNSARAPARPRWGRKFEEQNDPPERPTIHPATSRTPSRSRCWRSASGVRAGGSRQRRTQSRTGRRARQARRSVPDRRGADRRRGAQRREAFQGSNGHGGPSTRASLQNAGIKKQVNIHVHTKSV